MAYGRQGYRRRNYAHSGQDPPGERAAGDCRACGEEIPAGGGQLWREAYGAWSVVHTASVAGRVADASPARPGRMPGRY